MSDEDQKRVFSHNLNRLLSKYDKTQKEVADAIGVSPQTFNTWCQGIAIPRMGKVQKLADYFGVEKSALIDEKRDGYYIDPDTAAAAQKMFENPGLRLLFDAECDMSPEQISAVYNIISAFKEGTNIDDTGC